MSVPARINFVTLGVRDVARERAFYLALGWREAAASRAPEVRDTVAFFDLNGVVLSLYRQEDLAADLGVMPGAPAPGFRGVTVAVNVETPEEVEAILGEAVAAGGHVLAAAKRTDWGGVTGYFADPEGHAWELAYNPGMPLDADGRIHLE